MKRKFLDLITDNTAFFVVVGLKSTEEILMGKANWDLIFQPTNFFTKYKLVQMYILVSTCIS